tara:strand:- start:10439 stop:10870 length:432 start_codon:yes stop_codon:yes gene_type:complete
LAEKRSNKNHLRKSARELLVKAVYQWIITDGNSDDLLYQYKQDPDYKKVDKKYFDDLFTSIIKDQEYLNNLINKNSSRDVRNIDMVGKAILFIGIEELKIKKDVPLRVVINEAIELAKKYGAEESYKFINAVLDKVNLREEKS